MKNTDYLKYMPNFKQAIEEDKPIVDTKDNLLEPIIEEWAKLIFKQSQKSLIPLFITGSGVSKDIPNIIEIIDKLKEGSLDKEGNFKKDIPEDVKDLFNAWKELKRENKKDRGIVARLLNTFQERDKLEGYWKNMNGWLLKQIIKATPTDFHKKLADFYEKYGAMCLTLNFDGLLIKELVSIRKKRAFSLPTVKECENFFLRLNAVDKEFIELQVRGDILYLKCNTKDYCPQKGKEPQPLWTSFAMQNILSGKEDVTNCPSCGNTRTSYLSFPGAYEKEKDMREMLEVVWRYLAFRIGSVTVVGMSGAWDPLIVAFLGDLISEREIPLLVVDTIPNQKPTFLIRELVIPKIHFAIALQTEADIFMNSLYEKLNNLSPSMDENVMFNYDDHFIDYYWENIIKDDNDLNEKINTRVSKIECELRRHEEFQILKESAQLGLKSIWLGIDPNSEQGKNHDRYHHSQGVMKITSYLYDRAMENSGLRPNVKEKQFLRIAALLHDIGHLPFSHLIEEVFNELNWQPAGYISSFSHVLHTQRKIEHIFENEDLTREMENLGYGISDLVSLINGNFGIGYLDAIINSPFDADKIDYVFADAHSTGTKISLSPKDFLKDIVNGLTITPEKLLAFSRRSAMTVIDLLSARKQLYQNLYLRPGIRVLEGIVKQIIITYFVHTLRLNDEEIHENIYNDNSPDFGHYKILFCIKKIEELIKRSLSIGSTEVKKLGEKYLKEDEHELGKYKNNIELLVLILMYDELNKLPLTLRLKESLRKGFREIMKTRNADTLKQLEYKIKYYPLYEDTYYEKIIKIAKTCKLRMPGAIIIEVVKTPKFLSISNERKKKKRNDDTKTFSECILVPSGKHETWSPKHNAQQSLLESSLSEEGKKGFHVYLYHLSENDSYASHAENLFEKMKEQEILLTEMD